MAVTAMNHFTILTDDIEATVRFYETHLGLASGPRPAFSVPGAWLYCGDTPILHVAGGHSRDALRPGVIDHMAFSAENLSDTLARLAAHNVQHTCRRQPGSRMWQVFFFDPNGARVELDFAPEERAA